MPGNTQKAQKSIFSLVTACVTLAAIPIFMALLAKHWALPAAWSRTAPFITLSDGRRLAYDQRGRTSNKHVAFYVHGSPSCRLEYLGLSEDVLNKLDMRLVAFDRPGYGQSDIHHGRSYHTFVRDLEQLADHLQIERFFLIGVSGGGPYSWATAAYAPQRVKGVLIFSGAGNLGILSKSEKAQFDSQVNGVHRRIAHFVHSTFSTPLKSFLSYVFETNVGGRQLYSTILKPLMQNATRLIAEPDKECLASGHSEYSRTIVPQALIQQTATPWVQDLGLFSSRWSFDVRDIQSNLKPAIHLWHGTGDRQVSHVMSIAFKRLVPEAHLRIIDNGAHFAYFVCDLKLQEEALLALLHTAIS